MVNFQGLITMVYLERKDPKQNLWRFYSLQISPTLFGNWALVRRWGRIGAKGQKLEQWFEDYSKASECLETVKRKKIIRGYASILNQE